MTRATSTALDTAGTMRLAVINLGLVLITLPVPSAVRTVSACALLGGLLAFLALLPRAVRVAQSTARTSAEPLPRP